MDKSGLLGERKNALREATKTVRKTIEAFVDEKSFVETATFGFTKNEFFGEAEGEVVTGLATLDDVPVAIVALNSEVLSGGLTLACCKKIVNLLDKAAATGSPVVYFLSSLGVAAGEGVNAMEGVAEVLAKMDELKGCVPQFAVVYGDVLGSASLFVAQCDFAFFAEKTCVSYASPLVIAAKSGKSCDKEAIGGEKSAAFNNVTSFSYKTMDEVKEIVANVINTLPAYGGVLLETGDDLNRATPSLDEKACAKCLEKAVFDEGYFIETNKGFAPELVTGIGRIGGYSAATLIFNGENGVALTKEVIEKAKSFLYFCSENDLPVVTFVNTLGIKEDSATNETTVMKEVGNLVCALKTETPRINVIYGKAIGLGYALFASKAYGADYCYAFANSEVALFDTEVGARMELAEKGGSLEDAIEKYREVNMDAFAAAQKGYVDDVIEPRFVRQYLISALQSLI